MTSRVTVPMASSPSITSARATSSVGDREITHRIDSPHPSTSGKQRLGSERSTGERSVDERLGTLGEFAGLRSATASVDLSSGGQAGDGSASVLAVEPIKPPAGYLDPAMVRSAHTDALLDSIQQLSEELDSRLAKLNADIAIHERRERAFRLWSQRFSESLLEQRAACDRERQRLQAQARRMALTESIAPFDPWHCNPVIPG